MIDSDKNEKSPSPVDVTYSEDVEETKPPVDRDTVIITGDVEIRESFAEECMKLAMPQRLAKIRRLHNLDDQYYYDDDRLALSRVTDLERSDALQKRCDMILMKS